MRKIAIIKGTDLYYDDECGSRYIINSITDWKEVSDEDYKLLFDASYRYNFKILEQPINIEEFIENTIDAHLKEIKKQNAQIAKDKKAREELALQKKLKKEAKTIEQKKKLFEKLQEELKDKI